VALILGLRAVQKAALLECVHGIVAVEVARHWREIVEALK